MSVGKLAKSEHFYLFSGKMEDEGCDLDMPKSSQRKIEYNAAYSKETYQVVRLNIRKDSGIIEALELASQETGLSRNAYMELAMRGKIAGGVC